MAKGIKDKVAILGMGCAKFGERWDMDADSLMVEAYQEAMGDAGIDPSQLDAAWLGVAFDSVNIGQSGIPLSVALRLNNIGVTKVENYCASGTESFRGAAYAVASGACDIALAMGVEKLKDTGHGGLPVRTKGTTYDMIGVAGSAPGNFAQLASAYRATHGVSKEDLKRAMAHVSVKSHANGARNPKAHLRKAQERSIDALCWRIGALSSKRPSRPRASANDLCRLSSMWPHDPWSQVSASAGRSASR